MRTLIIHNSLSGFGSDAIFEFERALAHPGDECVLRLLEETTDNTAVLADAEDFDVVVLSGGDGTVTNLLYALREKNVDVCIFPSGTANLFFNCLGNAAEPAAIARACRMGQTVRTDLGEIMWLGADGQRHRRGFGLMAGLGFDAQLMQAAIPAKKTLGQAAYFTAALSNPHPKVQRFTITVDGVTYERTGISCMVANNARIQGDIEIVPNCTMDNNTLTCIVLETDAAVQLLKPLFFGLIDHDGRKIGRPRIEAWSGQEIRVESSYAVPMEIDGDAVEGEVSTYIARVLPAVNSLIVDTMSPYFHEDASILPHGSVDDVAFPPGNDAL
ncbi:MAG: diacylglycerol/lipid kinase family protein [Atopobiaceae bacterium]|jgi:diacylglycerol kinase family enzyme